MEEKELKIDLASVATQAMEDLQPGEDIDEALLRSCKKLYGESGIMAFQAIGSALTALVIKNDVDKETALQQLAAGEMPASITSSTETVTTETIVGSPYEIPPEIRKMAKEALASQKGQQAGTLAAGKSADTYCCENCGREFSIERATCPTCGRARKISLWSRLFGR